MTLFVDWLLLELCHENCHLYHNISKKDHAAKQLMTPPNNIRVRQTIESTSPLVDIYKPTWGGAKPDNLQEHVQGLMAQRPRHWHMT